MPVVSDTAYHWHLTLVFEKTIRANPGDRFQTTVSLLNLLEEVRYVVERGYPPLEEVATRCPSCGWQKLENFPSGHVVFGNPNPSGVVSLICSYCGFGFVRNMNYIHDNKKRLQSLK